MSITLPNTPEALLAERQRLEDLLMASEDWRALSQLRQRAVRGETATGTTLQQVEALLLRNLDDNPFYQRRQLIIAALRRCADDEPDQSHASQGEAFAGSDHHSRTADDLTAIRGLRSDDADALATEGICRFVHVRDLSAQQVKRLNARLNFAGRLTSGNWIEKAAILAAGAPSDPAQSKFAAAQDGQEFPVTMADALDGATMVSPSARAAKPDDAEPLTAASMQPIRFQSEVSQAGERAPAWAIPTAVPSPLPSSAYHTGWATVFDEVGVHAAAESFDPLIAHSQTDHSGSRGEAEFDGRLPDVANVPLPLAASAYPSLRTWNATLLSVDEHQVSGDPVVAEVDSHHDLLNDIEATATATADDGAAYRSSLSPADATVTGDPDAENAPVEGMPQHDLRPSPADDASVNASRDSFADFPEPIARLLREEISAAVAGLDFHLANDDPMIEGDATSSAAVPSPPEERSTELANHVPPMAPRLKPSTLVRPAAVHQDLVEAEIEIVRRARPMPTDPDADADAGRPSPRPGGFLKSLFGRRR